MEYLRINIFLPVLERFIARRLYGKSNARGGGSKSAVVIATAGVALGLAVMIATIAVTRGFKEVINKKVTAFCGHIQIAQAYPGSGTVQVPVTFPDSIIAKMESVPAVAHVSPYIEKPCIVRSGDSFQGLMLKGVIPDSNNSFVKQFLSNGGIPAPGDSLSTWMLLPKKLASQLTLDIGSKADANFLQDRVRIRRFTVSGLFETGFSNYDQQVGIVWLPVLQKLNSWGGDQYSGLEIELTDERLSDQAYIELRALADSWGGQTAETYLIRTTRDLNSGLFAWLDVLNLNVWIILFLMMGIAGFTMISGLLIIIFENTSTIGTLKSLGADDSKVRGVFLRLASYIVLKGMAIGNVVGLGLCILQSLTGAVPLDPANYYIDHVPVQLGVVWVVILNIVVFAVSLLFMLLSTAVISRISPARSVRFE